MKYLTFFRPSRELSDLILSKPGIVIPGSGLHGTVCGFYISPGFDERELLDRLSKIDFQPFSLETLGYDDFDGGALVLKLSKPKQLDSLHRSVASISALYGKDEPKQQENLEFYCFDNYTPHITISVSEGGFDRSTMDLFGLEFRVDEFYLARKDGCWKTIRTFKSNSKIY